ncbi:MAG: hypothetical protein AAF559_04200 [Pseudomonadota bacterium]
MKNTLYRRAAFGFAGAILAILLALQALSGIATRANPEIAVSLNGLNGLAREQLAALRFRDAATSTQQIPQAAASSVDIAIAAYRSDPLVPKALMIAALSASDEATKARIVATANQLNRRDLSLQGLVMEQRLANNDYAGVVDTLDQILRVHPEYSPEFFPLLEEALVEPGTKEVFEDLIDGSSGWHEDFLAGAVRNEAARIALAAIRPAITVTDPLFDRRLIAGLAEQGELGRAQSLYTFLQSDNPAGEEGDAALLAWQGQYPPFDWQFASRREIRAQESLSGDTLELFVRPGQGGVVARRYIGAMQEGVRLVTRLKASRTVLLGRVRLEVFCPGTADALASLALINGSNALDVPPAPDGCEAWRLQVYARSFRDEPTLRADLDPLKLVMLPASSPAATEQPGALQDAPPKATSPL